MLIQYTVRDILKVGEATVKLVLMNEKGGWDYNSERSLLHNIRDLGKQVSKWNILKFEIRRK